MKKQLLALLTAIGMALITFPLFAVTKHISLVGADGQPLANTTITIEFPDGTTREGRTDDKGILVFDFPGEGTYRILGPNGELLQTVSVGAVAVSGTAIAIVGGALGAVAIAANSDGNDSSSSPSTDPSGSYDLSFSLSENPGGHPDLLTGDTVTINFSLSGSSVSVSETSSNADFPDTLSGSASGNNFTLSGSGTYSGYPTQFSFTGSYDASAGTLTGTLTAGTDGALPGGGTISWKVNGTKK